MLQCKWGRCVYGYYVGGYSVRIGRCCSLLIVIFLIFKGNCYLFAVPEPVQLRGWHPAGVGLHWHHHSAAAHRGGQERVPGAPGHSAKDQEEEEPLQHAAGSLR